MKQKGFTLIELMVVVVIIIVIVLIFFVSFEKIQYNTKKNAVKTNHERVIEYIESEILKCKLYGKDTPIFVTQSSGPRGMYQCEAQTHADGSYRSHPNPIADRGARAANEVLKLKNPFGEVRDPHSNGTSQPCTDPNEPCVKTGAGAMRGALWDAQDERSAGIVFTNGNEGDPNDNSSVKVRTCYDQNDCDNNLYFDRIENVP